MATYHSSFMTNKTPSGTKSIVTVLNQKVAKWPETFVLFVFFLLLFSDWLAQIP